MNKGRVGNARLEQAAFSNFDPALMDDYDPSTGDYQNATLDIKVVNSSTTKLWVELFNYNDSFTRRKNTTYPTGNYLYIPQDSQEGLEALILIFGGVTAKVANTALGTVGFSANGDLVIRGDSDDAVCTVSCGQQSYRSLFESTSTMPMLITGARLSVTTDAQISNPIQWFKASPFGGKVENEINPRRYFKPEQQQSKIIDLPLELLINNNWGVRFQVEGSETITLHLDISRFEKLKLH